MGRAERDSPGREFGRSLAAALAVAPGTRDTRIDAAAPVEGVVTVAAEEIVSAAVAQHAVVTPSAPHLVRGVPSGDKVVTDPTADDVATVVATEVIGPVSAEDAVVAVSTLNRVDASTGSDPVITTKTCDGVASVEAADQVIAGGPNQPVVAGGSSDDHPAARARCSCTGSDIRASLGGRALTVVVPILTIRVL